MSPGKTYEIVNVYKLCLYSLMGGLMGSIALLWSIITASDNGIGFQELMLFFFGIGFLSLGLSALRQPYRLWIQPSGDLEVKKLFGKAIIHPHDIHFIKTGRRTSGWEGEDVRVVFITHDRGTMTLPNFDGAKTLFAELVRKYPHIRVGELDFQPEIMD